MKYVKSHNARVRVSGHYVTGVLSSEFGIDFNKGDVRNLGESRNYESVILPEQTYNASFEWFLSRYSIEPYLLGTGKFTNPFTRDYNFEYIDTNGRAILSGAYINQYSVSAAVGEIPKASITLDCNQVFRNTGERLSITDDFGHSFRPMRPSEIKITSFGAAPDTTNYCIQSFDLSLNIARTPITQLGTGIPSHRVPQIPIPAELTFSILQNEYATDNLNTGIWGLNNTLSTGNFTINLVDTGNLTNLKYSLPRMTFSKANETLSIDGLSELSLTYIGNVTTGVFQITTGSAP